MAVQQEAIPMPSHHLQLNIFPSLPQERLCSIFTVGVRTAQLESCIPQTLGGAASSTFWMLKIRTTSKAEHPQTTQKSAFGLTCFRRTANKSHSRLLIQKLHARPEGRRRPAFLPLFSRSETDCMPAIEEQANDGWIFPYTD